MDVETFWERAENFINRFGCSFDDFKEVVKFVVIELKFYALSRYLEKVDRIMDDKIIDEDTKGIMIEILKAKKLEFDKTIDQALKDWGVVERKKTLS